MTKDRRITKAYLCNCLSRIIEGDQGSGAGYLYDNESFDPETVDDVAEELKSELERRSAAYERWTGK